MMTGRKNILITYIETDRQTDRGGERDRDTERESNYNARNI